MSGAGRCLRVASALCFASPRVSVPCVRRIGGLFHL
jgi:hypothetical protein